MAAVYAHMMVSLREITDANRDAVEALAVSPAQRRFVSSVRDSILEAAQEPGAQALYWAIYDDDVPIGFVMIADEVAGTDYIPQFLGKLLIDERYQRRRARHSNTRSDRRALPQPGRRRDVDERRPG